jgi:hypothetical protein
VPGFRERKVDFTVRVVEAISSRLHHGWAQRTGKLETRWSGPVTWSIEQSMFV